MTCCDFLDREFVNDATGAVVYKEEDKIWVVFSDANSPKLQLGHVVNATGSTVRIMVFGKGGRCINKSPDNVCIVDTGAAMMKMLRS